MNVMLDFICNCYAELKAMRGKRKIQNENICFQRDLWTPSPILQTSTQDPSLTNLGWGGGQQLWERLKILEIYVNVTVDVLGVIGKTFII